jgi:aspartate/tyrosine/aromatic aminotransferase
VIVSIHLSNLSKGSVILLHACAHNPTGMDPDHLQWQQIMQVVKEKQHFTLFDNAYQGTNNENENKERAGR